MRGLKVGGALAGSMTTAIEVAMENNLYSVDAAHLLPQFAHLLGKMARLSKVWVESYAHSRGMLSLYNF